MENRYKCWFFVVVFCYCLVIVHMYTVSYRCLQTHICPSQTPQQLLHHSGRIYSWRALPGEEVASLLLSPCTPAHGQSSGREIYLQDKIGNKYQDRNFRRDYLLLCKSETWEHFKLNYEPCSQVFSDHTKEIVLRSESQLHSIAVKLLPCSTRAGSQFLGVPGSHSLGPGILHSSIGLQQSMTWAIAVAPGLDLQNGKF